MGQWWQRSPLSSATLTKGTAEDPGKKLLPEGETSAPVLRNPGCLGVLLAGSAAPVMAVSLSSHLLKVAPVSFSSKYSSGTRAGPRAAEGLSLALLPVELRELGGEKRAGGERGIVWGYLRKGRQEDSLGGQRRTASPVPSREAFNWSRRTDGEGAPSADGHEEPSEGREPGGGKRGRIKIEPAD